MRKILGAMILAAGIGAGMPALAQNSETIEDVRCVNVLAYVASQNPESEAAKGAPMMMMYFVGRLEGRSPKLDLPAVMRAEAMKMTPKSAQEDMVRCGQMVMRKGVELQEIGKSLQSDPRQAPST